MSEEPTWPSRWGPVLERMFAELGSGSARAEAYWAQQLAFGPVFIHAVALANPARHRDAGFPDVTLDVSRRRIVETEPVEDPACSKIFAKPPDRF